MSNGGKWVFTFEAPVNSRILRSRFFGVTRFFSADVWWNETERRWGDAEEMHKLETSFSSHAVCRSFAAFKRHLRKHPELRRAGEVVLESNFEGHDIRARWVDGEGKAASEGEKG